jgi:dienelactone hydrolase
MQGDLAARMVDALRRYMLARIGDAPAKRESFWTRDFASPEAYARSVQPNREHLRQILGATDPRVQRPTMEFVDALGQSQPREYGRVGEFDAGTIYAVRWRVLEDVDGEGLLVVPRGEPRAFLVAVPDADQTPEQVLGLRPGLSPEAQFARRLAKRGCQVLVPVLIDRGHQWSGSPRIGRKTQQPHREWVYRMGFEMGRHILGYEVQKVLAAVDWWQATAGEAARAQPVGVFGYGEGGLIALHAAALDTRIEAACISGTFRERDKLYAEPIYRNVWRYLREFSDAGAASLVAPRPLVIEASRGPTVGKQGSTPGTLEPAPLASTKREFNRAAAIYRKLESADRIALVGDGTGHPGIDAALEPFLNGLGIAVAAEAEGNPPRATGALPDPKRRLKRQLDQLVAHTQRLMRLSQYVRQDYWRGVKKGSVKAYAKSVERYRDAFRTELIGELPRPDLPPEPRTRLLFDLPTWRGYEVVLDVWSAPGKDPVFAYGVLCVPKDMGAGERRPVVVCQHGLEGRPQQVVDPEVEGPYHAFGARLAERGFVVFAPQNPYIGGDRFRVLQRMAQPLGCTLFSMIVRQHEVMTDWLAGLPFVAPDRIGFYGLSYGGKTAMRVPPLVERYCLSICSGDFNEWVWKNVTVRWPNSYMFTGEYEMYEWNLGHTFNYAEMAALICPRPFMVERGHRDGVGLDEWVAFEYAKVRRLYADLDIPGRTEIEYFDGPHEIHGVGTFQFLHRHLGWPAPEQGE